MTSLSCHFDIAGWFQSLGPWLLECQPDVDPTEPKGNQAHGDITVNIPLLSISDVILSSSRSIV